MQSRQLNHKLEQQLTATVPMEDAETLRETNALLQEELEDVHAALQAADEMVRAPYCCRTVRGFLCWPDIQMHAGTWSCLC